MTGKPFSENLRRVLPALQGAVIEAFVSTGRDASMREYIDALEATARRFAFLDEGCFAGVALLHYADLPQRTHVYVTAKALPCAHKLLWIGAIIRDGVLVDRYAKVDPARLLSEEEGLVLDPYFKPTSASALCARAN